MLTDADLRIARDAGIAVYAGRLILDARTPITDAVLAQVQAKTAHPVPHELVSLWRTSFGGRLDYDLRADLGGVDVPLSCTELFHPDSDGYRDLWGWIDHEREIGDVERLEWLPFAGFEYLDRVYAGRDGIVAWQQGLPPAWEIRPGDRAGRIADSVDDLFAQLALERDPWSDEDPDTGESLRDAVDDLDANGHPDLAHKLRTLVRSAVLDWRAAVESGAVRTDRRLRRLALHNAAAHDDVRLLDRLAALGVDPAEEVGSSLTPIDVAVQRGGARAAQWLLARGVPVTNALRVGAHAVTLELARELLARGARPSLEAAAGAVRNPDLAVLELLAEHTPDRAAVARRLRDLAQWSKVDNTRAAALRDLARRLGA
ncbi:ankyrin repeat domain-containing protein [Dactylosporangium sp. CS-033363]|uniref:ankyrin repeat domain-containing protein n=1 Tax=Dactylosporangium sp. CS-033363 TaxID=3239935 RepID=UPI003D90C900